MRVASIGECMMEFQRKGKVKKKTINTRHILFIVSGAFEGLANIIRKRMLKQHVGFGAQIQFYKEEEELNKYYLNCKSNRQQLDVVCIHYQVYTYLHDNEVLQVSLHDTY